MKKLIILSLILALIIISCVNKDTNPFAPRRADIASEGNPVQISFALTPTLDSVGVEPSDTASWGYILFNDVIDTSATTGITVETTGGSNVPLALEWNISGGLTDLILKPQSAYDFNTTYILRIIGAGVIDIAGNALDIDGDNKKGEAVDDDIILPFRTFKSDSTVGDPPIIFEDTLAPMLLGGYFLRRGDTVSGNLFMDGKIAVEIIDRTIDPTDTSIAIIGLPSSAITESTVRLIESLSGAEVSLSSVTYVADTADDNFGRVTLTPASDLLPATSYKLQVLGSIADAAGNKLNKVNFLAAEYSFTTLATDEDSTYVAGDLTPPTVTDWNWNMSSFEVEFSEMIDESTITLSTVYLTGGIEGVLSVRRVIDHTVVTFTIKDGGSVVGETAWVSAEIKDLAGNRMGVNVSQLLF